MKICIIGNSHVGALKRGWDRIAPKHPGTEITFFAHRANGMAGLKVAGNSLVPGNEMLKNAIHFTSGGLERITPADYDAFLIYGLKACPNFANRKQFISSPASRQALVDLTKGRLSFKLLGMLRPLTDRILYIGHDPLAAAGEVRSDGPPTSYIEGIAALNETIYRPLGAEVIAQPASSIVNGRQTHPDFGRGSKRLAIGDGRDDRAHPAGEDGHMNDDFGEIWMEAFLAACSSGVGQRVSIKQRKKVREAMGEASDDAEASGSAKNDRGRGPVSGFLKRIGLG